MNKDLKVIDKLGTEPSVIGSDKSEKTENLEKQKEEIYVILSSRMENRTYLDRPARNTL